MDIHVQVFVWTYVFLSVKYIPRSRVAGSYKNYVFNILKKCQTVLQSAVLFYIPISN